MEIFFGKIQKSDLQQPPKGDGTESLGSLMCRSLIEKMHIFKKSLSFGNGNVLAFRKYLSHQIWAIFGDFIAFGVDVAIIVKRKLLKNNFHCFYYGDFFPQCS